MPSSLGDHLSAARRRYFVGREEEQGLFENALAEPRLPFFVISLFGPGGVGKTTLLTEFVNICKKWQTEAVLLDAREFEPAPQAFLSALGNALKLEPQIPPLEAIGDRQERLVILVDTYETLAPLEDWVKDEFLPRLPERVLTVLAGRRPPPLAWRADPGWNRVIRLIPLRNLSPAEARAYLSKRQIPGGKHRAVLDFTHGHPLALSLVADTFVEQPEAGLQFEPAPDVVQALLEKFIRNVSGPEQRAALEVCSLVRMTTEPLLARMTSAADPHELFRWLQSLSFVQAGREGLFLHDLAREVLAADLRWRDPDGYIELHRRARSYYQERLAESNRTEQQRVLWDYIYLHRDNPVVRPFFDWQTSGGILVERFEGKDAPALEALVEKHEGQASARIAADWFAAQPQGVRVLRDRSGALAGFFSRIRIDSTRPDLGFEDPAYEAAYQYLENHAPLRSGEMASLFRFWMAADTYQSVSPAQSLIFVNIVRHYLTAPGLAYSFFYCANPDFWAAGLAYGNLHPIPEAAFEVGGRTYAVFGHDWRTEPPLVWLDLLAEREITTDLRVSPPPAARLSLVVLSREAFAGALRNFLRHYHRPIKLHENPLVFSRLAVQGAGSQAEVQDRARFLGDLIAETIDSMKATPKGLKFSQALHHTYLEPAPTQERAAEALGLPFSTYRRHLRGGIERLTETLWDRELGISEG